MAWRSGVPDAAVAGRCRRGAMQQSLPQYHWVAVVHVAVEEPTSGPRGEACATALATASTTYAAKTRIMSTPAGQSTLRRDALGASIANDTPRLLAGGCARSTSRAGIVSGPGHAFAGARWRVQFSLLSVAEPRALTAIAARSAVSNTPLTPMRIASARVSSVLGARSP